MFPVNKKLSARLIAFLLIISLALSTLSSCTWFNYVAESKDEIVNNINSSSDKGYDEVADYLRDWGFPNFDTFKFSSIEQTYNRYYNYAGGMPAPYEHARETAELYLEHYYGTLDEDDSVKVTDALLTCYVYALDDPYSAYRPYEETEEYFDDMSGKFGGIGVMIEYDYKAETIMVNNVYPGSPADRAGLQAGDFIIGVDGKTIQEIGLDYVVYHVRGEIGTEVQLTILRGEETLNVIAVRDEVEEINASKEYDEETGLGYISIVSFKDNTFAQFKNCVDELEALGAKGIVFDLRNNPGGYLHSVIDVISYVIPTDKLVVSYQYKGMKKVEIFSEDDPGGDHTVDIPMVIICNEYTASAGEIFTAALRDYDELGVIDATIVGTNTYGKGIMQDTMIYSLDQSSCTMTVAYYDPPCGVNYHGTGITPDVKVELTEDGDVQLDAAYEALKSLINANNN